MRLRDTLLTVKETAGGDRRLLAALAAAVSALTLLFAGPEARQVLLPFLVIATGAVVLVTCLWGTGERDTVPLFEIGTVYGVALAAYSLIPLLNFLLAGLKWTPVMDNRLLPYRVTAGDVGGFAWNHVVYFLCFSAAYLWTRGRVEGRRQGGVSDTPPLPIVLVPVLLLFGYFLVLKVAWGVDADPSYLRLRENLANLHRLPLLLAQVSSHLRGIMLVFKFALLFLLFTRWESKRWRSALCAWLALDTAYTVVHVGARFETALLLISALLFYHRLVRPMTLRRAVVIGLVFLTVFQAMGLVRSYVTAGTMQRPPLTPRSLASAAGEFQSIFATAYDLDQMKKTGRLGEIPAQLYVSDFLMPVPQQLLGMKKLEPSRWYLQVKGIDNGTGYMFGVVAQSVIGFGLAELALRGVLVGALFAWIHRWYRRRSSRFLPTLVYVWLCVWSYYTFRASTFYLLTPFLYRVLPVVGFIYVGQRLVARLRRPAAHGPAPAA